jgi:hypothetical protein
MSKYVKVVRILVVHVLGSVKDRTCLTLAFMKSNFHNCLEADIGMYSYAYFTLRYFPYDVTYDTWHAHSKCRGYSF